MVALPSVPDVDPTFTAQQSRVSGQDISNVGRAEGDTLDSLKTDVETAATPAAQAEGALAGQQMVTRDPNGNTQILEQPHPLVFGKLGEIERQSALMAFHVGLTNAAQTDLQAMAAKTMLPAAQGGGDGDPEWFRNQAAAYVKQIASNQRGGFQATALQQGNEIAGQFYRNLQGQKSQIDAANQKQTFMTAADALDDQNVALARSNYNGPEFIQGLSQYKQIWQQLASDPRMGVSPALADAKYEQAASRYKANALVGTVERSADPNNGGSWDKASQTAEQILTDPNLNLDEHERRTYYNMAIGQIRLQESDRRAQASGLAIEGNKIASDIAHGVPVDPDYIDDFTKRASNVGAISTIGQIAKSQAQARIAAQFRAMPTQDLANVPNQVAPVPGLSGDQVDPTAARNLAMQEAQRQGLVGVVPSDGAKYGIKTGSAEEWGNYFVGLAQHESGLNNQNVGDVGSFGTGSRGLYQLSQGDAQHYGLNNGKPFSDQQLADPYLNTAAAVSITKQLLQKNGTIQAGPGQYWGPINNEGWTPGTGRDKDLPWQQWAGQAGAPIAGTGQAPQATVPAPGANGWTPLPPRGAAKSMAQADAVNAQTGRLNAIETGQASPLADPFVAATYAQVAKERIGLQIPAITQAMDAFEVPPKADVDALGTMTAMVGTPQQQRKVAELGVRADFGVAAKNLTNAQFEAFVSQKSQDYQQQGSQAQQDAISWAKKLPQEIDNRFKSEPWSAASWMGIPTPSTGQTLDFSNPQNLASGLQQRAIDGGRIQSNRGIPAFSALTPAELPQAKDLLKNGAPAQQAGFIGALSTLPPDMQKATLNALHDGGDVNPQIVAASIYQDAPQVAQSILTGVQVLKSDRGFENKMKDINSAVTTALPPADFSLDASGNTTPDTWMAIKDAVAARAADLNFKSGKTADQITTDTINQSIKDVTGGYRTWQGKAITMPLYGMGDGEFSKVMNGLTPADLQGAQGVDGKPIIPADLTKWFSPYKLQSGPDGKYLVYTEAGGNRQYVGEQGVSADRFSPLVLDLKGAANRVLRGQ